MYRPLSSFTFFMTQERASSIPSGATTGSVSCTAEELLDPLACVASPASSSKKRHTLTAATGLKALRKHSHDRLQGYQHLFYLLQTEPRYLATLIFALPSAKTTRLALLLT